MCGIAGFIDFNGDSSKEILHSMIHSMSHRGPDGMGSYFHSFDTFQIGLAHNRLSIIDLSSAANQPFYYKKWVMVFNGEIYNYKEIKQELSEQGHQFSTTSDTEMILHAFEHWGIEKSIEKFIGMFAIVLFDKETRDFTIIRDRAGVKPLYYYWENGLFMFASELKAFHHHPKFSKKICMDAVGIFLKYCYIPAPNSIFKNTFKLEQGHFLEFQIQDSKFQIHQYWNVNDAYAQPKFNISESDAIIETEKILMKAFEYRMVADVPVGVFLSGGYDSSAVAALLQNNTSQRIKTFTIGFHEAKYNEATEAKLIADYLGTDHTEYYCTIDDAKKILPMLPHYYDEPYGDSSAIPTMLVSQMAKKSVTVALSADGGDEIFGGYNRYPIIQKMDRTFGRLPSFTRNIAYTTSGLISPERIPILKDKKLIGQRYSKFRKLIKESSASAYLKSMCSVIDDETLTNVLVDTSHHLYSFFDEKDERLTSLLDTILPMDYKTYMADDILTKVDRATMSVALEGREPFLDQHIIEWVARLPNDFKIRNGIKKYILKEIVHKHIPKSMMDRPKAGFGIPIELWFQSEFNQYFSEYFNEKYIQNQGIFNYAELNRWVKMYQSGKKEYMTQIWNILMFQLWYEKWMKS